MAVKRYYYKAKNGNGYLNLKSPLTATELENYEEITAEEFNELTQPEEVEVHEPTEEEIARQEKLARINFLKHELARTDYVALKLAEGECTKQDYADVFAARVAWRAEINELQEDLGLAE